MNSLIDLGATEANILTASARRSASGISSGIATPQRLYIASNYQCITGKMARPTSNRPAGQSSAQIPIPIVISCHRVIASDGTLGGYNRTIALDLQRWLRSPERAQL